jgi:hypothetical protein
VATTGTIAYPTWFNGTQILVYDFIFTPRHKTWTRVVYSVFDYAGDIGGLSGTVSFILWVFTLFYKDAMFRYYALTDFAKEKKR